MDYDELDSNGFRKYCFCKRLVDENGLCIECKVFIEKCECLELSDEEFRNKFGDDLGNNGMMEEECNEVMSVLKDSVMLLIKEGIVKNEEEGVNRVLEVLNDRKEDIMMMIREDRRLDEKFKV